MVHAFSNYQAVISKLLHTGPPGYLGRISHLCIGIVNTVVVSPAVGDSTQGNSITANRWARILRTLGHAVSMTNEWNGEPCDTLITLHGRRSHSSIQKFRQAYPQHPLILALTGTDLYVDGASNREVLESLHL